MDVQYTCRSGDQASIRTYDCHHSCDEVYSATDLCRSVEFGAEVLDILNINARLFNGTLQKRYDRGLKEGIL